MNRIVFNLVLILTLGSLAACSSPSPRADAAVPPTVATSANARCATLTFQSSSMDQSAPSANSLRLVTIEPIAGTRVRRSTVLVVDLAFAVKEFDSGSYIVFGQFDTSTPNRTTDGTFSSYPPLKFASGNYHLCFPLADIWNAPNVKRPLSVHFLLNKIDDAHHNHAIALTDRLSFPTD